MKFAGWALQILAGPQTDTAKAAITQKRAMEAGQHLFEHVLPIVQKRRADPIERDDLIDFFSTPTKTEVTLIKFTFTISVAFCFFPPRERRHGLFETCRSEEDTLELPDTISLSYTAFSF